LLREVRLKCFRHDSQNLHTSPFFFKQIQQNGEEFSDRLLDTDPLQVVAVLHGKRNIRSILKQSP
jgi:hypothetical protein